jgi:hypothetical protein
VAGAKTLAMIWDSAWREGDGRDVGEQLLGALDEDAVRARYVNVDFVPSRTLTQIAPLLT